MNNELDKQNETSDLAHVPAWEGQDNRTEDALHFARKHEQRAWGSGGEHEKARAEVERLEARL